MKILLRLEEYSIMCMQSLNRDLLMLEFNILFEYMMLNSEYFVGAWLCLLWQE
jgi:hypothetical protein